MVEDTKKAAKKENVEKSEAENIYREESEDKFAVILWKANALMDDTFTIIGVYVSREQNIRLIIYRIEPKD